MMYVHFKLCLACAIGLLVGGCQEEDSSPGSDAADRVAPAEVDDVWFVDVASEWAIDFNYQSGAEGNFLFPEIMGGGVALFDLEGDGDLDIYFVQGGSVGKPNEQLPNLLFRNDGDGTWTDVTAFSGAGDTRYGMGVAAGDIDSDGDVDLYVTNVGPNTLLLNNGDGSFDDVSVKAGVAHSGWGTSAAFFDHDGDGDLDLYLCNYVGWTEERDLECFASSGRRDYCSPNSFNAAALDVLYRNNGDGTFSDISLVAGMRHARGNGLGVVAADFDGDGHTDVFVANDQMENLFWKGFGHGTYEEVAMDVGCAMDRNGQIKAGMGVAVADVDDDLDLDLLVVNLEAQSDSFFRNAGRYFLDETNKIGLAVASRRFTRFGVGWCDFNNDGALDQFQANGRVTLPDDPDSVAGDVFGEHNLLMQGIGDGRFETIGSSDGTEHPARQTSRGAAFGDLDNDGAIDVVIVNRDGACQVLRNQKGQFGRWVGVRCINKAGRDDHGAAVFMQTAGKWRRRDVRRAYSYCASSDARVHFGLGQSTVVEQCIVQWSDGTTESFSIDDIDTYHTISQGSGSAAQRPTSTQ